MAENVPESDKSRKIACRSRQAVNFKIEMLYTSLDKTLQKNATRAPVDKIRYTRKFREVYEKLVQQNIAVIGDCEGGTANTTPEYEPVDKQKQLCINEELLPLLDDCIVKVAKQRKRMPRVCHNSVTNFSNHQAAYMSKVKPKAKKTDLETVISDCKDVTCFIDCEQLCQPCAALSCLSKTVPKDQERAAHLNQAMKIEAANKKCQTAVVMCVHSPLREDGQPTTKKRMADCGVFGTSITSSKVARVSAVSARDFVVQPLTI